MALNANNLIVKNFVLTHKLEIHYQIFAIFIILLYASCTYRCNILLHPSFSPISCAIQTVYGILCKFWVQCVFFVVIWPFSE